jgi:hypothetical protein
MTQNTTHRAARDRVVRTTDAEGRRAYQLASEGREPSGQLYYSQHAARESAAWLAAQRVDENRPVLTRYADGVELRNATDGEWLESIAAARHDGGAGVITVLIDGAHVDCYVQD